LPNPVAAAGVSAAVPPGFTGVTNQISVAGNKNPVLQPPQPIGNDILTGGTVKGVERGGLKKEINTNTETTIDNSKKIGTVNIHPSKGLTPAELMEWQELN
ncbi:phage tail tape measure protein, partial [Rahnella variigena]|nr:phage tail tape measure protein [Rahnella variigena]